MRQPDLDEFTYFTIELSNMPQLPSSLFGLSDDRRLGVALNTAIIEDQIGADFL